MQIKNLLLIFFIILSSNKHIYSQEKHQQIIKEVDIQINELQNIPLRSMSSIRGIGSYSLNQIYIDKNNVIRLSYYEWYEQDLGRMLSYYDKQGNLIKILFFQSSHSSWSGSGRIYFHQGKAILMIASIEDDTPGTRSDTSPKDTVTYFEPAPAFGKKILGELGIVYHSQAYTNLQYAKNVKLQSPFQLVHKPKPGESRFISANYVNARSKPGLKGKVQEHLNTLKDVKILEVLKPEKVQPWGTYPWYKISYKKYYWQPETVQAYVFGAFLEPFLLKISEEDIQKYSSDNK